MKKKDWLVIAIVALILPALYFAGRGLNTGKPASPKPASADALNPESASPADNASPAVLPVSSPVAGLEAPALRPFVKNEALPEAGSYLRVKQGRTDYAPIPISGQTTFLIRCGEWENRVSLSPEGIFMQHSNCSNQSCVKQGTVSLKNREGRVLYNRIICLPHELMLELLSPDEAQSYVRGQ